MLKSTAAYFCRTAFGYSVAAIAVARPRSGGTVRAAVGQCDRVRHRSRPGRSLPCAAKENAAAAVKEPGCHAFDILVSQRDPSHVLLVEAYDNAAAVEAHRETAHFKKYAGIIKEMIAKREARPFRRWR